MKRGITNLWRSLSSIGRAITGTWLKVLLVIAVLVAPGKQTLAQEGGWSTPAMISTNTVTSWFSDVAVDDWGQPHVVWNSGRFTERGVMDLLMYSTLTEQGWLEPSDVVVTAYGGATIRPAVAVDHTGILHVTFRGETTIYYSKVFAPQARNAFSWARRRLVSGAGAGSAYYSDIAVDEQGGIHVVWNESVLAGEGERWVWFGTTQGGALYDGTGWRSREPQTGLGNRQVYAAIEDSRGVQWFGTDEGVYRFDGVVWQILTAQDGLVGRRVYCIAEDPDGRLWFGTDSGVSIYDEEAQEASDKWTAYTVGSGLPANAVHAIAVDYGGNVWVGTENGLASYDGLHWASYTPRDGLVAADVLALATDVQGGVWIGTGQGVSQYNQRNWTTYTVESGLLSNVVTAITIDREGAVWLGTDRGLSRFDGLEWTSYTAEDGLVGGAVTALMVDREGRTWVGTETGVSHYNGQVWKTFELPQELAGQKVTAIAEDRQVNAMCPLCADIFYRHSTDGGKTWSAPVNLSNTFAGSVKPQVHVGSGSNVYVVWEEGEDWYTYEGYPVGSVYVHSSDGGNTWTEPVMFSSPKGAPQQITLGVGWEGDLVVVWRLPKGDRFYYQHSTDNGATWSEPQPIPGVIPKPWASFSLDAYHTTTDSAGHVHLFLLGYLYSVGKKLGLIHLVWNGSEWSPPIQIYASTDPPEWPRADVGAGNKVYVTWFSRDEKHINDSERGRYKIWVSFYQADAPSQTPVPVPTSAPTPAPDALGQDGSTPTSTPTPLVVPDSSPLPPGIFTESDEVARLALALAPIAVVVLVIFAVRFGKLRRCG